MATKQRSMRVLFSGKTRQIVRVLVTDPNGRQARYFVWIVSDPMKVWDTIHVAWDHEFDVNRRYVVHLTGVRRNVPVKCNCEACDRRGQGFQCRHKAGTAALIREGHLRVK